MSGNKLSCPFGHGKAEASPSEMEAAGGDPPLRLARMASTTNMARKNDPLYYANYLSKCGCRGKRLPLKQRLDQPPACCSKKNCAAQSNLCGLADGASLAAGLFRRQLQHN